MESNKQSFQWPKKYELFGVGITATNYEEAVNVAIRAAQSGIPSIITALAVHGLITARREDSLKEQVNTFDMVVPDGQPVRWALNLLYGTNLADRVYGPELMLRLCERAASAGIAIYLYGSHPHVVQALRDNLLLRYPSLKVSGFESPPFRPLTLKEDKEAVKRINESDARLIFLGLGCPLQDHFAYAHRHSIRGVQLCVGAAFDFHSGNKRMAPRWMQCNGLEWLYRLGQEPRRLWRRYLVTNGIFVSSFCLQFLRLKLRA